MVKQESLIPDFDQLDQMVNTLGELKRKELLTKHTLKALEASYIKRALTDQNCWVGGKRPTMSYCERVVAVIGNTEEEREALLGLRTTLAELAEGIEITGQLIRTMRDRLDLYRTLSANERNSLL